MSCVKKIALTLSLLLAVLAGDAFADCGGKTVYIKLPDGWGSTTYITWEGQYRAITGTASGSWTIFTLPAGLPNDGDAKTEIIFVNSNSNYDQSGGIRWVNTMEYGGPAQNQPSTGKFPCSQFGTVTYIMENPTNPGRTSVSNNPPDAYYFHYLPPKDAEWIMGTSSIVWDGNRPQSKITAMDDTPGLCGWFKLTWFNDPVPPENAWIWLNASKNPPDGRLGARGIFEDPEEWPDENPTPFNLKERFNTLLNGEPGDIYYNANGNGSWTTSPSGQGVCEYGFAALIYDTDKSKNSSFTTNDQDVGCGGNQYGQWTSGVVKGMVKQDLNPTTRKIECANCTQGCGAFASEALFNAAFDRNSPNNNTVCYNMPFTRTAKGLWEFDSDKQVNRQGKPLGGFYPEGLQTYPYTITAPGNPSDTILMVVNEDCGAACATKYKAESFVNFNPKFNPFCFERGLISSSPTGTCGASYGAGDFAHGEKPAETWGYTGNGAYNPNKPITEQNDQQWNDPWRYSVMNLWGGSDVNKDAKANSFYCFESHAEFTYEKGQEFFFRGDDDIWVYMNNKLVVDLGGSHLAAPAYVVLDSIGISSKWPGKECTAESCAQRTGPGGRLLEGEKYPIDIFFCDRRTTMSNVRITTNMYFSQNSGLYVQSGKGSSENSKTDLCMLQGGGGGCADVLNSAGGSGGSGAKCADLENDIEYFLSKPNGTEHPDGSLWTPPGAMNSQACKRNGNILTCYGGIIIDLYNGTGYVDQSKVNGIQGSWTVYARSPKDPENKQYVGKIVGQTIIRMVWGNLTDYLTGTPISGVGSVCNYANHYGEASKGSGSAITGELFPVCFAQGEFNGNGFDISEDGIGANFGLKWEGFKNEFGVYDENNGLRIYDDSLGQYPTDINKRQTIPDNGVLVLWVSGGYEQEAQSWDYTINIAGQNSDGVTLHSLLPKFAWIKEAGSIEPPPACSMKQPGNVEGFGSKFDAAGCPVRSGSQLDYIWVGEDVNLKLRAYNPLNDKKTCTTCSFLLRLAARATGSTETGGNLINHPIPFKLDKGEAIFDIQGRKEILLPNYATVDVMGPKGNNAHSVRWDSLQFRKPPVPIPENVWIYDDNGDGWGDRVVIVYSRGFRRDSLPNALEVRWDPDTTVFVGKATKKDDNGNWSNEGISVNDNIAFWKDPNHFIKLGGLGTDIDSRNMSVDSTALEETKDTIILLGKFSREILTQGDGKVTSYATFEIPGTGKAQTSALTGNIDERIPAIVVKGTYIPGTAKGCGTRGFPCGDVVRLEFSEPVTMDTSANKVDASDIATIKNSFAYILSDKGKSNWDILENEPRDGSTVRYGGRGNAPTPKGLNEKGDTEVEITFERWQEGNPPTFSQTPTADDSVKFAYMGKYMGFTKNVLMDLKGNMPNPKEIGRLIEGKKPFGQEPVQIASVDPADKDKYIENIIERIKSRGDGKVPLGFFGKERPVEIIPVLPSCDAKCIDSLYPGTVGILIDPDFSSSVGDLRTKYGDKVNSIKPENITIYSSAFYHTNLGTYVADRAGFSLKCNDPIFPKSNCLAKAEDKSKLYVAWNLKDMKGRFVGAGAYVGIYDFRWEVYIPDAKETVKMDSFERKIEMHGVKRTKRIVR